MRRSTFLVAACLLGLPDTLLAQSVPVTKTNPMKVYVHMMPWFQTSYTLGGTSNWGSHWTMANENPNIILPNGERQIASNYYPLTGPYDSSDPNIIEYQMLLMKLSGIDGTILDWYGTQGSNGDEASLLSASNTIINKTSTYGLNFAVCLEDRFATSTSEVTANINYAATNYFTKSNYITAGSTNTPLMPMFGPITYQSSSQWTTILSGVSKIPDIVPLQYQAYEVGAHATGEMAWVYQDANTTDNLTVQQNFLANEAGKFSTSLGDAYTGYNDFYAQGGWGAGSGFVIPENNGQTLSSTLANAQTYSSKIAALQLVTWNDYGEGTMLEPTVQNGFSSLLQIQQFTGVSYGLSQLQLVYQLYEARVQLAGNATAQSTLNTVSNDINGLNFPGAIASLATAVTSAPTNISNLASLTLSGSVSPGALDLTNHHLIVTYTAGSDPIGTVRSYLHSGYNGGAWNGLGIISSSAASNAGYALGYADSADPNNPANLPGGQIEIAYTLYGDLNLDGVVNGTDFGIMAANFGQSVNGWDQGDMNYDGTVNGTDFALLAQNFGKSADGTAVALPASEWAALDAFAAAHGLLADVPEPAALPLVAGLLALIPRRRTKRSARQ
jgi:hypothetical protein